MKKIFVIFALLFCHVCLCVAQIRTSETLTTNVKTPNGVTVPDTYIMTENPPTAGDIAAAQDLVNMYGGTYLGDPTWTYNCHGYAWHKSEGGTPVAWIGWKTSTAHNIYWNPTNGGYIAVAESNATKVDYPQKCNHSAVRESQYVYVSKWGAGPLVRHAPLAVPPEYHPQYYNNPGSFGFYARATYTVTFNLNGAPGTAPASQTVPSNTTATKPTPDPDWTYYTFGGWFTNSACTGSPFKFSTPIMSNTILYAKWTPVSINIIYTVTEYSKLGSTGTYTANATGMPLPFCSWYLRLDGQTTNVLAGTGPSLTLMCVKSGTGFFSAPGNSTNSPSSGKGLENGNGFSIDGLDKQTVYWLSLDVNPAPPDLKIVVNGGYALGPGLIID